jgi:trans-aconitate methyltransferase
LPAADLDVWDLERQVRFDDERRAPFLDLLARV